MIGRIIDTEIAGTISITALLRQGAQGQVYITSHPEFLLKVWHPRDAELWAPEKFSAEKADAAKRYSIFSSLGFEHDRESTCLPLEYRPVYSPEPTPTYVMRRATGQEMGEDWKIIIQLDLLERMHIARSLANAISFLHSHQVVHGDIKPDNFFVNIQMGLVQVLDIDGGGYWGTYPGTEQFWPAVSTPIPMYQAPEIVHHSWRSIWAKPTLRTQPDLWSLAVLIYQMVADRRGPFPTKMPKDDPAHEWFWLGDYAKDHPDWPRPWQRQQLKGLGLDSGLIELFEKVFSSTNRMRFDDLRRPSPMAWREVLNQAIERKRPRVITSPRKPNSNPPLRPETEKPPQQQKPSPSPRPKTVTCPNCGHIITDLSLIICPKCAEQKGKPPIALWGNDYNCPLCGHNTPAQSPYSSQPYYCVHCGAAL